MSEPASTVFGVALQAATDVAAAAAGASGLPGAGALAGQIGALGAGVAVLGASMTSNPEVNVPAAAFASIATPAAMAFAAPVEAPVVAVVAAGLLAGFAFNAAGKELGQAIADAINPPGFSPLAPAGFVNVQEASPIAGIMTGYAAGDCLGSEAACGAGTGDNECGGCSW